MQIRVRRRLGLVVESNDPGRYAPNRRVFDSLMDRRRLLDDLERCQQSLGGDSNLLAADGPSRP